MDLAALIVYFGVLTCNSFQLETHKIYASGGLKNGGNVSINFSPVLHFSTSSQIVNCWWSVNENRVSFFENYNCALHSNATCSKNASYVSSTLHAEPITKRLNASVVCNPKSKGSTKFFILFAQRCQHFDHINIIPSKYKEQFGQYNSTGWFQCLNNGTPVYESGINRTQPTVCLPNATWEGQEGLHCVTVLLMGNYIFNLTKHTTILANFTCHLESNPDLNSVSDLRLHLGSVDVQGNFTVKPDHNEESVKCSWILNNKTVLMSEKKLKVYYQPTILNLTVVSFLEKSKNSYKIQQNSNVTIHCNVDSNPPSKCTWYNLDLNKKITQASPSCNLTTIFYSTSNISCHASNDNGSTAVETVQIVTDSPPKVFIVIEDKQNLIIGASIGAIVFLLLLSIFVFWIHVTKNVKKSKCDETNDKVLYISNATDYKMDEIYGGAYIGEQKQAKQEPKCHAISSEASCSVDEPYGGVYIGEKKQTKQAPGVDDDPFVAANFLLGKISEKPL